MEEIHHSIETDHFTDLCRKFGLRITPQRTAVFQILGKLRKHPSAEEIFAELKAEFPHLSFDTVYRTLNTFAKVGLVRIVEGFGKSRRFDPNLGDHHHLHCVQCGAITDFYSEAFDDLEIPTELDQDFQVLNKRVVLSGICSQCKDNPMSSES